jgi:hypothetical protein
VRGESGQVECGNAHSASRRLRRSTSSGARALPAPNTKRWVVRRKAAAALRCGAITIEEACRRYGLSEEKFLS